MAPKAAPGQNLGKTSLASLLTNVLNLCVWQRVTFSFLGAKSPFIYIFLIFNPVYLLELLFWTHTAAMFLWCYNQPKYLVIFTTQSWTPCQDSLKTREARVQFSWLWGFPRPSELGSHQALSLSWVRWALQLWDNIKPSLHNGITSPAPQLYNLVNPDLNSLLKVFAGK